MLQLLADRVLVGFKHIRSFQLNNVKLLNYYAEFIISLLLTVKLF